MSNDRLEHIKKWYLSQQDVVVEIPQVISYVGNMKKIYKYNGYLSNVKFVDGKATIRRDDVYKIQAIIPDLIIHEPEYKFNHESKGDK